MAFFSPIWLIALVPWSALAVWLFQGRRPQARVPFLALWQSGTPVAQPKRKIQVIPPAVMLALLAALCCIFAAARPSVPSIHPSPAPGVTLIVDRGMTMSAGTAGEPRYVKAAGALADAMRPDMRSAEIELVTVPGQDSVRTTFADCAAVLTKIPPTACDTTRLLPEIVSARLAASGGPVIVITDRALRSSDRLIRVAPEGSVRNIGIALLAARATPAPQVMVRVRNQSALRSADLVVTSAGGSEHQSIELPEPGQTRDYFFNPSGLGTVISAQLHVSDDLPADDRALLVREGNSPRIEPRAAVDPSLGRLIAIYQRSRPPADESSRLVLVSDAAQLPADAPAVLMPREHDSPVAGPIRAESHPITAHVGWDQLPVPLEVAGEPPVGWKPLAWAGDRTIVAIRTTGPRQVWVGFDAQDWSRTADYVVFWTNIFDWAGGGGARYVFHPLSEWTAEWKPAEPGNPNPGMWPGLYRRSDRALRAFNAPDVPLPSPAATPWHGQLAALASSTGRTELSGPLCVVAAGCLALAASTWKKRRLSER